jgi:[FeFe] hydrogenase H-cluster maturation GTPase HydF
VEADVKALTVQVGIFGRTNVGKSSLMNFITNQKISIVSEIAGTTTDVVWKQMELNPLGLITFFDTAGIDDTSLLGYERIEKTKKVFDSSDIVILMCESGKFEGFEEGIIKEAEKRKTPYVIVVSKIDLKRPDDTFLKSLKRFTQHILLFSSVTGNRDSFLNFLKRVFLEVLPDNYIENCLSLRNIVKKNDTVILVMPIDLGTPRGKIIMPQVQMVRHILDLHAASYIVQDIEYEMALQNLKESPVLVITDSQAVKQVSAKTPKNIKITTFSIIYASDKSDITEMARGAVALNNLKDGDRVLIVEGCTHHATADDIGRVKLPKWIAEHSKKNVEIRYVSGQDYPKDLKDYKVIIHCGGCTLNRKYMLSRLNKALEAGVPMTNYGISISVFNSVIERVLEVFPWALSAYKTTLKNVR